MLRCPECDTTHQQMPAGCPPCRVPLRPVPAESIFTTIESTDTVTTTAVVVREDVLDAYITLAVHTTYGRFTDFYLGKQSLRYLLLKAALGALGGGIGGILIAFIYYYCALAILGAHYLEFHIEFQPQILSTAIIAGALGGMIGGMLSVRIGGALGKRALSESVTTGIGAVNGSVLFGFMAILTLLAYFLRTAAAFYTPPNDGVRTLLVGALYPGIFFGALLTSFTSTLNNIFGYPMLLVLLRALCRALLSPACTLLWLALIVLVTAITTERIPLFLGLPLSYAVLVVLFLVALLLTIFADPTKNWWGRLASRQTVAG